MIFYTINTSLFELFCNFVSINPFLIRKRMLISLFFVYKSLVTRSFARSIANVPIEAR